MNFKKRNSVGLRTGRARSLSLLLLGLVTLCGAVLAEPAAVELQKFLIRDHYLRVGKAEMDRALAYRLQTYTGIRETQFLGQRVLLHQAVHGPLACVERAIRKECKEDYKPKAISGWRSHNSYRDLKDSPYQEYSNHIFGLAIDIDPERNPCCGCVADWAKAKRCKQGAKTFGEGETPLGRYDLPQCWIDSFRRYGFYWLGDDPRLRDTMHFEYLAEPGAVHCPLE